MRMSRRLGIYGNNYIKEFDITYSNLETFRNYNENEPGPFNKSYYVGCIFDSTYSASYYWMRIKITPLYKAKSLKVVLSNMSTVVGSSFDNTPFYCGVSSSKLSDPTKVTSYATIKQSAATTTMTWNIGNLDLNKDTVYYIYFWGGLSSIYGGYYSQSPNITITANI